MDSRLIPLFLAAGWLLVTLGVWGASGRWWVWPLAVGLALLATGAGYGWAMWRQLLAGAGATKPEKYAERFEGRENPGRRSA